MGMYRRYLSVKSFLEGCKVISRYFLGCVLSLSMHSIGSAETTQGAHKFLKGAVQPDPAYVSGQPVLYFSISKYALAEVGATLAYSVFNSYGKPVIFYDEESLAKLPANFQRWIFGHELEHFNLGHFDVQNTIYQKSAGFEGLQGSYERNADCAAVKKLQRKYSLTRKEFEEIANTAQKVFHESPLQRKTGKFSHSYSHRFRYDDAETRAKNIIACYDKNK